MCDEEIGITGTGFPLEVETAFKYGCVRVKVIGMAADALPPSGRGVRDRSFG